jgi:predicted RecB family nuclease
MNVQKITSELVVAYWQCPRKAFLMLNESQQAVPHEIYSLLDNHRYRDQQWYFKQLQDKFGDIYFADQISVSEGQPVLLSPELQHEDLDARIDILLKDNGGQQKNNKVVYVPILVSGHYSITQDQKIILAFVSHILSRIQKNPCTSGKVMSRDRKLHLVKLEKQGHQVNKIIRVLRGWIQEADPSPPMLILNKHCPLCQFQKHCRSEAIQTDHLSLLSGLKQKQIREYNKKGIFTVTQLAYTYRARKQTQQGEKHLKYKHALKAMAIRDQKIYVTETKEIDFPYPHIFLDVEGLPDEKFYYLIGLLTVTQSTEIKHAFWADHEGDEESIWNEFLNSVSTYEDFTIFHYGSYERHFIETMAKQYGDKENPIIAKVKSRLVNVLSMIYGKIYFPTYSNSLKDIGSYIGQQWKHPKSNGLQSIVWRYQWEESKEKKWKAILVNYNREDCQVLRHITSAVTSILKGKDDTFSGRSVTRVETIKPESTYKFGKADFLLSDFEHVNNCAYYDYQREKVYFRAEKRIRHHVTTKKRRYRINKQVEIPHPNQCEHCGSTLMYRHSRQRKVVFDIYSNGAGVKRWVVQYQTMRIKCRSCNKLSVSEDYHAIHSKYGHNFFALIVYNSVSLRQSHGLIAKGFSNLFGYEISRVVSDTARKYFASLYEETYKNILIYLQKGMLIHADETTVNLRFGNGYIWVFTSMTEVAYVYSPTREGSVPRDLFADFTGVLVSDFFSGYDALNCPKQRCLIHLIRDMNDDLRKNPFDSEFKLLLQEFAALVRSIMNTIDRFGLKRRYLSKHRKEVDQFYCTLLSRKLQSEVSIQYKDRLNRWKGELFTFLNYDGVPWNNNNAEHAVKMFAIHRQTGNGFFTEAGIKRFLILLSIHETCRYRQIDFLDFLRSGQTDLLNYPSPIIKANSK